MKLVLPKNPKTLLGEDGLIYFWCGCPNTLRKQVGNIRPYRQTNKINSSINMFCFMNFVCTFNLIIYYNKRSKICFYNSQLLFFLFNLYICNYRSWQPQPSQCFFNMLELPKIAAYCKILSRVYIRHFNIHSRIKTAKFAAATPCL